MKTPRTPEVGERAVRSLLDRYQCPTPFAAVRALFMGVIASPAIDVSPMGAVAALWGGELPRFESSAEVEILLDTLVSGLWNRLSRHQDSRDPFRLTRESIVATRQGMAALAAMRVRELDGFMDGLFGGADELSFPEKAHQALTRLGEVRGMFDAAAGLLADEAREATPKALADFARNTQEMTRIADELINKIIQSCKRARAGHLEAMSTRPARRREAAPDDDEPPFVRSPLSQSVTRHGVTVQVEIYGDGVGDWILEVVDHQGGSYVWDDRFPTDAEALAEAISELERDPMEFSGEPGAPGELH